MKTFLSILFIALTIQPSIWLTNIDLARKKAQESQRPILIYFSGSDWCTYCKKLEKSIIDQKEFIDFAEKNVVLLNIDNPKKKQNELDQNQKVHNEQLQRQYNSNKEYPKLVLMTSDGKILKTWIGDQHYTPEEFNAEIARAIPAPLTKRE